jgi:hypothetical protein
VTADQCAALLAHLQLLTRRLFDLSGLTEKIELMQSLQDLMSAFEVET